MFQIFLSYFHYLRVKLKLNRKSKLTRLLKRYKPSSILEIGVDEGENAIQMISTLNRFMTQERINYTGVDLFSSLMNQQIAKHEASQIPKSKNAVKKVLENKFPKLKFDLVEGNSNIVLKDISTKFEFIFIDGGHSYSTVKKDFELSEKLLDENGIIVLDDYTNRKAEYRAGYGVRSFVKEIDRKKFKIKITFLPDLFWHNWGVLITRLVVIQRRAEKI